MGEGYEFGGERDMQERCPLVSLGPGQSLGTHIPLPMAVPPRYVIFSCFHWIPHWGPLSKSLSAPKLLQIPLPPQTPSSQASIKAEQQNGFCPANSWDEPSVAIANLLESSHDSSHTTSTGRLGDISGLQATFFFFLQAPRHLKQHTQPCWWCGSTGLEPTFSSSP